MILYKYCPYNANSLSIIINQKVWYCKPADFNDPFDGDFCVDHDCSFDDFLKIFKIDTPSGTYKKLKEKYCGVDGKIKKEIIEKEENFLEVFKNIGVLSLTPHKENVLMWSHYSDDHRGFSIGFNIEDDVPVTGINYSETLPKHHLSYFYKIDCKGDFLPIQFTKHTDWDYEDERRISVQRGNRLLGLPGKINEINFGCRMTETHKETLTKLVRYLPNGKDIKLFSAVKIDNLTLSFETYNSKT